MLSEYLAQTEGPRLSEHALSATPGIGENKQPFFFAVLRVCLHLYFSSLLRNLPLFATLALDMQGCTCRYRRRAGTERLLGRHLASCTRLASRHQGMTGLPDCWQ